jgi:hypothetical protein
VDPFLFVAGLVRVVLWLAAAGIALVRGHRLLALGLVFAGLNSVTFAVSNAGGEMPRALFLVAAVAATPIAALILAGVVRLPARVR